MRLLLLILSLTSAAAILIFLRWLNDCIDKHMGEPRKDCAPRGGISISVRG